MSRPEINRYAVYNDGVQTDIVLAGKNKERSRWCKTEEVEQLEKYCDKLEAENKKLIELLKDSRSIYSEGTVNDSKWENQRNQLLKEDER